MPRFESFNRVKHERHARFHVEYARAEQSVFFNFAGHVGEGAKRIDSIEMTEQQHWFLGIVSDEIDLEIVSVLFGSMQFRFSSDSFEGTCEECAHLIGSLL